MTNPASLSDRITAGLHVQFPWALANLCREATEQGLQCATSRLLLEWRDEVLAAAEGMESGDQSYWLSIAAGLQSLALEKESGVRV
jgi:hypothetical protein